MHDALVNKSAHGVRKINATRAANVGATVAQLKALFGWTDSEMASLYIQTADRRKLARDAIEKLTLNSENQPSISPQKTPLAFIPLEC